MNIQECDILNALMSFPYTTQRDLSEKSGHSLGIVNRSLKSLAAGGYLDGSLKPTPSAISETKRLSPQNAVILAAGYGMRMVPINMETPKGLLEIHGEPLIERIIRQLHEAGIREIYIVVGFMKEHYEYLIDLYGVDLIVNTQYASKNNLYSLWLAAGHLSNTYIVPCDIWCAASPFRSHELYSWYMVSESPERGSSVRVNRKSELVTVSDSEPGNAMLGISYITADDAPGIRSRLKHCVSDSRYDHSFWEEALYLKDRMTVAARVVPAKAAVEINTYEQLRKLDSHSSQLKSDAVMTAAQALGVSMKEIREITILKKGMTNRSFLFVCKGKKYIMRIPGEGTDRLISRKQEAQVYSAVSGRHICDDIVYMNPDNGYKITEFLEGARVCDPKNPEEVRMCFSKLRGFHEMKLKVDHRFDLFGEIDFYEELWDGTPSAYKDYQKTKKEVFALKTYIDSLHPEESLTHIDAVPDNFLFFPDSEGKEKVRLIDWEYAGMQDPHVDIAMFCIYSFYSREQIDQAVDFYFGGNCPAPVRLKIYCYIAVCGLLWSNWCEYKRKLGVDFGEYSLRQYRYAKEYYKIVRTELDRES